MLKAGVEEVENTMKEMLGSADKLQAYLDEANTLKVTFENQAKTAEDQVAILQCEVQELQSQIQETQVATYKVVELEAELQEMVARGGEMFI